jgi:MerR family transcriptional regulator, copper efflux regulator
LRYYENYGLFKGSRDERTITNNYRHYDESLVEKVELIKEAKEIGFTLTEIKKLLDNWYNKRLSVEKRVEILNGKIAEVDGRIRRLKQIRKLLLEGIKDVRNGEC